MQIVFHTRDLYVTLVRALSVVYIHPCMHDCIHVCAYVDTNTKRLFARTNVQGDYLFLC